MTAGLETSWKMIRGAAAGDAADRAVFARRWLPCVRAFFAARWARSPLVAEVDDATQEVFLECFRPDGVLARAQHRTSARNFGAFLRGVMVHVAQRVERFAARAHARCAALGSEEHEPCAREESVARLFDRSRARWLVRQALDLQLEWARTGHDAARRQVEILQLRFGHGLPIRAIAARWGVPAEEVHAAYRKARREYQRCLEAVVALHHRGPPTDVRSECRRLLALLS